MAGLDDLYAQISTSDIASKLGADQGEVDHAVRTLVPVLLSGLQHNSQDPEHADKIEELLGYPEDTAGGIMTKDLCGLAEGITPTAVDSEGFIKAIRTRLEAKLA